MKRALMLVLVVALAVPAFAQTPRDRGGESGSSTRQYSDSFLLLFPQGKTAEGIDYRVRLSLFSVGSRGSSILLGVREASSPASVPADGVANIEFASTESLTFSFLRVKSEELGSEIIGQAEILAGDAVSATVGLVESSRNATTLAGAGTWIAIANPSTDTVVVEATLYFDYSGSVLSRGWRTSGSDTVTLRIEAGGWRGGFVAEFFELLGRVPKKLAIRCVTPVAFDAFSVGEGVSQQAVYREK